MVFRGEDIAYITRIFNATIAIVATDPTLDRNAADFDSTVATAIIHALDDIDIDIVDRPPNHIFDTTYAVANDIIFRIEHGFPLRTEPHTEPGVTPP